MIKGIKNMSNMTGMIKQAQKAQQELKKVQSEFKNKVFEEKYAQDNITIKMDGDFSVKDIKINTSFVDKDDMEMLEESIAYAVNKMHIKVDEYRATKLNTITAGMSGSGIDLGKILG